jgi:internalin A
MNKLKKNEKQNVLHKDILKYKSLKISTMKTSGITLIALVITIIVMLILAGVSLNAMIGNNGVITQAQTAKMAQAVAKLNEYMQSYAFDKRVEDKTYDIEKLYVSSGWLERKIEVDEEGNAYYTYIINKSKINDEDLLAQIDSGTGDPYSLKDVYGINPDFSVWYRDKSGNLINSEVQVVAIDDNTEVHFSNPALSSAIANAVGVDVADTKIGQLKNVTTLKLNYDGNDSDIKNLDDLYYLPNLKYLYIYNLNLDNIEGLKYASNLYYLESRYNTIANFDGLQYLSNLKQLQFYGTTNISTINDNNISEMFSKISSLQNITKLTINSMSDLSEMEKLNTGLQNLSSKSNIAYLYLYSNSNLSGDLNLTDMNNLKTIECYSCQITKILGLENMKLGYLQAQSNNLQYIGNLVIDYETYPNAYVYLQNNSNIEPSSITAISNYLINAAIYKIDAKYAQYIEGNTTLDYSSLRADDVTDGYITEIANSVTTVNLNGKNKLTNIDFLKNKNNITSLDLANCYGIDEENLTSTLSTLSGLVTLNLQGCYQLTDISFINNMPNLQSLYINNTSVEIDSDTNTNAEALNSSSVQNLNIGYSGTDEKYKCNNTNLTYIQPCISNLTITNGLQLSGNDVANQTFVSQLEKCTEITQLTMKNYTLSGVSSINLSKCTELKELRMNYLGIDSLNINGCSKLEIIELTNMKSGTAHFNAPDFSYCLKLNKLIYTGNFMTSTEFNTMCTQLQNANDFISLNVSTNSISDINKINLLSNLFELRMNQNNISDISSINSMSKLGILLLQNNNLDNTAVSDIATLSQTYNKLSKSAVYIGGNSNITDITLLTDLGFNETNLLSN